MNRKQRRAERKQVRPVMHVASPGVQEMFADAVRHHQAGRLHEAERLYRQILAADSRHADSLHLLGVIAYQVGHHDLAADLINRAIAINANDAVYHSNLSNALKGQGRLDEAVACCRRAIDLKPDFAEAHNNLGNALKDQGRLDDAVACYRQALVLKPNFAEVHNNLGKTLKDQGRLDDAVACYRQALMLKPDYAEAHNDLGIALKDQGKLDEAVACYRQALVLKPDYAGAHNNLGITLKDQGKLDEAVACFRQALVLKPDYAEVHNNLGSVLKEQGKLDEAVACLRQALVLKPDFAEVHNNLGNARKDQGILDEAVAFYRRALVLKPDYADAHNNLGIALKDQGKLDEAVACCHQAIALKPDYADAFNNLALLLMVQGNVIMALNIIKQSLQIKEVAETKKIFIDCITRLRCTNDDSEIRIAMVRALTEPWGRPSKLARVTTDLIKLNPDIGECIARAAHAWPRRLSAQDLFGSNGLAALAANELLCALLCSAPISDIEMERFLTMARRLMLEAATGIAASDDDAGTALSFYSALARQCFINEYVFCHTDDEIQQANDLRDLLVAALEAGTQLPVLWVLTVAAYFPLFSLPLSARLLDTQWPAAITAILVQQVREPEEEMQLRATIPQLTTIDDEVSRLVQNQYEENPYPRWVKAEPAGNLYYSVVAYLGQKFPLTSFKRHGKSGIIEFLIAGCGTGQHSIETAQSFKGARVLAVDLSLSSLSYAKRKTRELGLASIEYAQADLLKLGALGRDFDVIEAIGVLHHLADPLAGWRILLSLLRPGGFMRLGFYSEVARRDIAKARSFIAEQGYGATANEIRQSRQHVMDLDKSAIFRTTINSLEFFSISACRDLLFHVQEHGMLLTGIDAFLRENNLTFLGFEIDGDVLHAYKLRFPHDPAATNLGQWQTFENENSDTFAGMYQLWIQKTG
jgi:tetratricopeptide (TPR) repeat protein/SAM-dependent methyltransferase